MLTGMQSSFWRHTRNRPMPLTFRSWQKKLSFFTIFLRPYEIGVNQANKKISVTLVSGKFKYYFKQKDIFGAIGTWSFSIKQHFSHYGLHFWFLFYVGFYVTVFVPLMRRVKRSFLSIFLAGSSREGYRMVRGHFVTVIMKLTCI